MARYTKHIHIRVNDDLYSKAKAMADVCCEGRIAQLVRMLIEKEYERLYGKPQGDKA